MKTKLEEVKVNKFTLKEISVNDYKGLFVIGQDKEMCSYLNWGPILSINEAKLIINNIYLKRRDLGLPPGYAIYYGDVNYTASENNTKFTLNKQNISLDIDVDNVTVVDEIVVTVTTNMTNDDGGLVINIGGTNYTANIKNNVASITVNALPYLYGILSKKRRALLIHKLYQSGILLLSQTSVSI